MYRRIRTPNKLIAADVSVRLHGCNLESQPTSLFYTLYILFCLPLIASRFKSSYIRLSLHWLEEKRKGEKNSRPSALRLWIPFDTFLDCWCSVAAVSKTSTLFFFFFLAVCADDDISETLCVFDASIEGWSSSDFHRWIKRQHRILEGEFNLGDTMHPYIHTHVFIYLNEEK